MTEPSAQRLRLLDDLDGSASEIVATRVRELRKRFGWSVDDLASRCVGVGVAKNVTGSVIYLIEGGRREKGTGRRRRMVTVDEWLTLSAALAVHPLSLLPLDGMQPCETCFGAPPTGFTCGTCGSRGDRPPRGGSSGKEVAE